MPPIRPILVAALAGALLAPRPGAAQPPTEVAAPDTAAGHSALDGTVVDVLGRPLAGAVVQVEGLPIYQLSSERGTFAVRGLRAGPQRFVVRRVGYQPVAFEVELPDQATVHVNVKLAMNVVRLGTMVIEGQAHSLGLWRSGFYERATRQATGYFYPPEEILRRNLSSVATLLAEIPGLVIETRGNARVALGRSVGVGNCPLNLWVDGALAGAGVADLDQLAPAPIIRAVEVYPAATTVPSRYERPGNRCGAILVWTKGVVRDLF